ncbi:hypothetical protein PENTCL1PPCAC_21260, partial [Pristionchus entomophagus]
STMWFVLSIFLVTSFGFEDCRQEDCRQEDCRSCRDLILEDLANCPGNGFKCDESEPLSAAVLTPSDPCTCQSLRCARKGWRLAVNGTIVDKVWCKGGQWLSFGFPAASFVCAKGPPCPAVPQTSTAKGYFTSELIRSTEDGTIVYSCETGWSLISVEGSVVENLGEATISCKPQSGIFEIAGAPVKAEKFTCGLVPGCTECDGKVDGFWSQMNEKYTPSDTNPNKPPTCEYTCPSGTNLIFERMRFNSVICRMGSLAVTLDSFTGPKLADPNKFQCDTCACGEAGLNDGGKLGLGLCPKDRRCTKPTLATPCTATCPADSTPLYKDLAGMPLKTTITCTPDNKWIGADVDTTMGITCLFAPGKGECDGPCVVSKRCSDLMPFACDTKNHCDETLLVYVPFGEGYQVMCRKGSLVTDSSPVGEEHILTCPASGIWTMSGVSQAKCVTDDSQVAVCLFTMTETLGEVDYECAY